MLTENATEKKSLPILFGIGCLILSIFMTATAAAQDPAYCTEPTTFTYQSIASGSWSSGATWVGGVAPSGNLSSGQTVLITHEVTRSGDFKPASNTVVVVKNGGKLTTGKIQMDNRSTLIIKYGTLHVNGDFQPTSSNASICGINACIYVSKKIQPDGGSLYLKSSGLEIVEIFQSKANISGSDIRLWVKGGELKQDGGSWTGAISYYRVSGSISGIPAAYRPASQSSEAVIKGALNMCAYVILPVHMLSFATRQYADKVELLWTTSQEQNNMGFQIERSFDGINWNKIGFVNGRNNMTPEAYNFMDLHPGGKVIFYRLKQIDRDLDGKYSSVHIVRFAGEKNDNISLHPNPVLNRVTLTGLKGYEIIYIYNGSGQCVRSFKATDKMYTLDVKHLPPASYTVLCIDDRKNTSTVHKILKIN